jgi:hypothetical protein
MCVFKYHAFIYFLHPPPPWPGTPSSYLPGTNIPDLEFEPSTYWNGVSLKLIKYVTANGREHSAHIFSSILESEVFPVHVKLVVCTYLRSSLLVGWMSTIYRPVFLLSTFPKILVKNMAVNLTDHLQLN